MVSTLVNGFMAYTIIDMNTTQVNKSDAYKCIKVKELSSWFGSAVGKGIDVPA